MLKEFQVLKLFHASKSHAENISLHWKTPTFSSINSSTAKLQNGHKSNKQISHETLADKHHFPIYWAPSSESSSAIIGLRSINICSF